MSPNIIPKPVSATLSLLLMLCPGIAGAFNDIPDLIDGLPADTDQARAVFNARVQDKFPAGTKVGRIADDLEDDGFTVNRPQGFGIFQEYSRSCDRNWIVRWGRKNGFVTSRDADVIYNCP